MCGSKGSAPTPSAASTTTSGTSAGSSAGSFGAIYGPSAAASPYYNNFLSNAWQSAYGTPFNAGMLGQVAPMNMFQDSGLTRMFQHGLEAGQFDPAKVHAIESPYTEDVVNATQGWFNNQNAVQGNELLGGAIKSGNAFGGDRAGVAEAALAGQQQTSQAPVIAGLRQAGYSQALDEYNKLKQFGLAGDEEAVKAGTVHQAQQQRELDTAQQNQQMVSAYPFQLQNWLGSILGGIGPLTGSSSQGSAASNTTATSGSIVNPPAPNPITQGLGIASSLAGLLGFKEGGLVDDSEDDIPGELPDEKTKKKQDQEDSDPSSSKNPNIAGALKVKRYGNPFHPIPLGQTGSGNSNAASLLKPPQAQQPQAQQASSTSSDDNSFLGTLGSVVKFGAKVAPLFLLADGGGVGDEGDTGDTGDLGDTGDTGELEAGNSRVDTGDDAQDEVNVYHADAGDEENIPVPRPRPAGLGAEAAAPAGGLGGGRRPSVTQMPGLGRPEMTAGQRWAASPFTQAGAAMLQSKSPYLGAGIGAGVQAASGTLNKQRGQDLLDARPQMITHGDTIQYRVGDKIFDTGIPTSAAESRKSREGIAKNHEAALNARSGTPSKTQGSLMERERDREIARAAKEIRKNQESTLSYPEARRQAIELWNAEHGPDRQIPLPPSPAAPTEPEAPPAKPGSDLMSSIGSKISGAAGAFKEGVGSAVSAAPGWLQGRKEALQQLDQAAAGSGSSSPSPSAPSAPQQSAQPDLASALKSGATTQDQAIADARKAIANKKNPQMVWDRLRRAGVAIPFNELISGPPGAAAAPAVPMSQ